MNIVIDCAHLGSTLGLETNCNNNKKNTFQWVQLKSTGKICAKDELDGSTGKGMTLKIQMQNVV